MVGEQDWKMVEGGVSGVYGGNPGKNDEGDSEGIQGHYQQYIEKQWSYWPMWRAPLKSTFKNLELI